MLNRYVALPSAITRTAAGVTIPPLLTWFPSQSPMSGSGVGPSPLLAIPEGTQDARQEARMIARANVAGLCTAAGVFMLSIP
jgi:hypothetical protein